MNVSELVITQSHANPDKIAIYYGDKTFTYKALNDLIWKFSNYLYNNNVRKDDVIVHMFGDEFHYIISMLATARIGASVFSLPSNTPDLLKHPILSFVKAKFISTDNRKIDSEKIQKIVFDLNELMNEDDYTTDVMTKKPSAPWLIVKNSGTTGSSRYLPISHKVALSRAETISNIIHLEENDLISFSVHLDFNVSKSRLLSCFYTGASVVIFNRKQFSLIDIINKYRLSSLLLTVFHAEQLLLNIDAIDKERLPYLNSLTINGSIVSDELRNRIIQSMTQNLYVFYGSNESGLISSYKHENLNYISRTVGTPVEGTIIEIVDENGTKKEIGEIGNIRVKSSGMIDGYLDDEEATKKAFKEGWFYPGDLGKLTEEGELIHLGRSDDMMIMNGINIYPAQIENAVMSHEAIKDAVAFPICHPIHQDIPVCAVVLRENILITKKELMNYCVQRLGSASPKEIVFLDEIPKNEHGKIMKEKLQEMVFGTICQKKPIVSHRQVVKKFTYNQLVVPSVSDFSHVDGWLREAFNITLVDNGNDSISAAIQRILLIVAELFQGAKIPVYFKGDIVSIKKNSETKHEYTVDVEIGYFDFIDERIYLKTLSYAPKIFFWMLSHEINPENKRNLYAMSLEFLNPILKKMPPGESRIPVLKAAYERGIPFFHLGNGIYQLGFGSLRKIMDRSSTGGDSMIGGKLSENKFISTNLFRMAGIPAPKHRVANNLDEAKEIVKTLHYPVVVKPLNLNGGVGISTDIDNDSKLETAFHAVRKVSKEGVIIEKQVAGICHRLFVAQGELLYAVVRHPISVQGNGKDTISQLISAANQSEMTKPPWRRGKLIPHDDLALKELQKSGYTFETVPAKDQWIGLRNIESTLWGGRDEEVTQVVHPANIDIALRATALFGLEVAGIDIITSDITKPWYETGAILNEVNMAPTFGVGGISNRHLPLFFDRFIENDGRIPIDLFVGSTQETFLTAKQRQQHYVQSGKRCYLTQVNVTYNHQAELFYLESNYLTHRIKSLLMNSNVDALVVVVENDEFLYTVLPFDKVSSITVVSDTLYDYTDRSKNISKSEFARMLTKLFT